MMPGIDFRQLQFLPRIFERAEGGFRSISALTTAEGRQKADHRYCIIRTSMRLTEAQQSRLLVVRPGALRRRLPAAPVAWHLVAGDRRGRGDRGADAGAGILAGRRTAWDRVDGADSLVRALGRGPGRRHLARRPRRAARGCACSWSAPPPSISSSPPAPVSCAPVPARNPGAWCRSPSSP